MEHTENTMVPAAVVGSVTALIKALGADIRVLVALWRDSRARSREVRAFDATKDMNEHMLRDIGAHDRLISHAAARRDADHRRRISVQLLAPLLVVALNATASLDAAAAATDSPPTSKACAQAQTVGVFTGEYVDRVPVYHLPPVIIVASRKVERTKLEHEGQFTRGQQARAKAAAKHPA
jgi:hypothetical protein